jgi:hypothetical protein
MVFKGSAFEDTFGELSAESVRICEGSVAPERLKPRGIDDPCIVLATKSQRKVKPVFPFNRPTNIESSKNNVPGSVKLKTEIVLVLNYLPRY